MEAKDVKIMDYSLFHGSGVVVKEPELRNSRFAKDFGYGFYCTNLYSQAEKWAKKHNKGTDVPTVNIYRYTPNPTLKVKCFSDMSDEWLDFIAMCRSAGDVTPHDNDIVEGPMADDDIWTYVEDYVSGQLSREQFWTLAAFRHPTHQISFHTREALACLSFERMIRIDEHE